MSLFDLFKSRNTSNKKSYFKELIKVAKADGHLEKREYDLILKIGDKLAYSANEIQELSEEIEHDDPVEASQSKEQRLRLVFDLVAIMMIDGTIDPKELGLCKSIAMKSGFEPEVIDDIVHRINRLTQSGRSIEQASNETYLVYNKA